MAHKHDTCTYNAKIQPCTSGVVEVLDECRYSACTGWPHCHCACKCHSNKTCECGFSWPRMDEEWPFPKPYNWWRDSKEDW